MKKLLNLLACAILISAVASTHAQESVYSVNIVGFQRLDIVSPESGGLDLIANPFDKEESYIDLVVGTNGTAGTTAATADNVTLFDTTTQTMRTFWLFEHSNPEFNRRWRDTSGFATNVYLTPGMGYWYRNRGETSRDITLVGDVVMDDEISMVIVPGLQILAYPYSTSVILDDLSLTNGVAGVTAATSDNLTVYNAETQSFQTYWLFEHANPDFDRRWRDVSGFATNVVINPGQGFWYRSRSESSFEWSETRPYDL